LKKALVIVIKVALFVALVLAVVGAMLAGLRYTHS
jgi:hypothetical protein